MVMPCTTVRLFGKEFRSGKVDNFYMGLVSLDDGVHSLFITICMLVIIDIPPLAGKLHKRKVFCLFAAYIQYLE